MVLILPGAGRRIDSRDLAVANPLALEGFANGDAALACTFGVHARSQ